MYGNRPCTDAAEESPYDRALRAVTSECLAAGRCSQRDKALILELGARASEQVRDESFRQLGNILKAPAARGGETYENVIALLDRRKKAEWTATELRRALARYGHDVSAKRLSDVTNYLVRAGRLKRIWRGHYLDAAGAMLVTSEEMPQFDIARGGENED